MYMGTSGIVIRNVLIETEYKNDKKVSQNSMANFFHFYG